MHEKAGKLEKLLSELISRYEELKGENELLKKQVDYLEKEKERISRNTVKIRDYQQWRERIKKRIAKICLKIDKVADSEDTLFSDL